MAPNDTLVSEEEAKQSVSILRITFIPSGVAKLSTYRGIPTRVAVRLKAK